jgi:thiosulfate dehydrogenase
MTLNQFAAVFVAACVAITLTALTYRPLPAPIVEPESAGDYGKRLVTETFAVIGPESTLPFAGNRLACQSCHLDAGTNRAAVPLAGAYDTYPRFSARSGRTISLTERINECMTRSMNGKPLPETSREMDAFLAYIRSMRGDPAPHNPTEPPAAEPADATRGAEVYGRTCAVCHQPHGLGKREGLGYVFPPLWGADSFNDGAGMDRFDRAVRFIRHNMPRGVDPANPQLSLQEAWDVAAFLQSRTRPHYEAR